MRDKKYIAVSPSVVDRGGYPTAKVGKTEKERVDDRMKGLSNTSVPIKFVALREYEFKDLEWADRAFKNRFQTGKYCIEKEHYDIDYLKEYMDYLTSLKQIEKEGIKKEMNISIIPSSRQINNAVFSFLGKLVTIHDIISSMEREEFVIDTKTEVGLSRYRTISKRLSVYGEKTGEKKGGSSIYKIVGEKK